MKTLISRQYGTYLVNLPVIFSVILLVKDAVSLRVMHSTEKEQTFTNKQGVTLTLEEWIAYLDDVDFESYRNIQGLYDMWKEDFSPEMREALDAYYRKRKAQFRKTGR